MNHRTIFGLTLGMAMGWVLAANIQLYVSSPWDLPMIGVGAFAVGWIIGWATS